jgi:F0F1-type ATP synthase membrane subunit a
VGRRGCGLVGGIVLILFIVAMAGGAIGRGMDINLLPSVLDVPSLNIESFFRGESIFARDSFLPITNTLIASWVTIIVVTLFAFLATRKMRIIPGRLQSLVEMALEGLLNFIEGVAGHKNGRKFFPVVATIFIFVMFNAYLALLPVYGPVFNVTVHDYIEAPASGTVVELLVHPEAAEEGENVEETEPVFKVESEDEDILRIVTADGEEKLAAAPNKGELEYEVEVGQQVEEGEQVAVVTASPPLLRSASTDVNMTLALAVIAVLFIELMGLTGRGFKHYIGEYINVGELIRGVKLLFKGKIVDALMATVTGVINMVIGVLEFISHSTRMISFTFRLFGNMSAGEILLLSATFLIPWVMAIPFYGLELLIGFIQALIFGGLTLVFATIAAGHGEEDH